MTLGELCKKRTSLTDSDVELLELYETALPAVADLVGADVFLDCLDRSGTAFVVSHARPAHIPSQYHTLIQGLDANRENEPAVYNAFEQGLPFHDTIANTQENKTVLQDVTPVFGSGGVIAVLISEHDISQQVQMEKKLQAISDAMMDRSMRDPAAPVPMSVRESNHRIKNDLQLLSSLFNLKGRQAESAEVREAYASCSAMLFSVSRLHELFMDLGEAKNRVSLKALLQRIVSGFNGSVAKELGVTLLLEADPVETDPDKAVFVTLSVNELILNALKYAFDGTGGTVRVRLTEGNRFCSVVVEDDGRGASEIRPGTGLSILQDTVRSRLGGELTMSSGPGGTKAAFTFPVQS